MRIPSLQGPSVSQQPKQAVQFTAQGIQPFQDQSGAQTKQLGQSIQRAGQTAYSVAEHLQDVADDTRTKEADALFMDALAKAERDPANGYLNKLGRDAVDDRQKASEQIDEARERISGLLGNALQREMFTTAARARTRSANERFDRHFAEQSHNYAVGGSRARLVGLQSTAVSSYGSSSFQADFDEVVQETRDLARLTGAHPDAEKLMVQVAQTEMHQSIIENMVASGRMTEARDYLVAATSRGEVVQEPGQKLRGLISAGEAKTQIKVLADKVMKEVFTGQHPGEDGISRLQHAQNILQTNFDDGIINAEQFDAAFDRIQKQYAMEKSDHVEAVNRLQDNVEAFFTNNEFADMTDLPAKDLQTLTTEGRLDDVVAFMRNGRTATSPRAMAGWQLLTDDQRRAIPKATIESWRKKFDDGDMKLIRAEHAKARGDATPDQTETLSMEQQFRIAAVAAKILTPKDVTGSLEGETFLKYSRWKKDVQVPINDLERTLGRKLTAEEREKELDRAQLNTVLQIGTFSNTKVSAYGQTDEEAAAAGVIVGGKVYYPASIDKDVRDSVIRVLKAEGRETKVADVVNYWVRLREPKTVEAFKASAKAGLLPEPTPSVRKPHKIGDERYGLIFGGG